MPFDPNAFNQMLENYLNDNITLEIVNYLNDGTGFNLDVGETKQFDLRITNKGNLGLLNVYVQVTSQRGIMSQSYFGFSSVIGGGWMDPWLNSITVRPFNLPANYTHLLRHENSGGPLFAYKATETTGGTDNNRDIETLLRARIAVWQPDLNIQLKTGKKTPTDAYDNFIQRS